MPHTDLTSSVPTTEYEKKFLADKTLPVLKFSYETVSSVFASLDTHKATGADGFSA